MSKKIILFFKKINSNNRGAKSGKRRVGIGVGLEIGYIVLSDLLVSEESQPGLKLGSDIGGGDGKFSAAPAAAEDTAAPAQGSVPVGTGQSALKGYFIYFFTITPFHLIIQRVVGFFTPELFHHEYVLSLPG